MSGTREGGVCWFDDSWCDALGSTENVTASVLVPLGSCPPGLVYPTALESRRIGGPGVPVTSSSHDTGSRPGLCTGILPSQTAPFVGHSPSVVGEAAHSIAQTTIVVGAEPQNPMKFVPGQIQNHYQLNH